MSHKSQTKLNEPLNIVKTPFGTENYSRLSGQFSRQKTDTSRLLSNRIFGDKNWSVNVFSVQIELNSKHCFKNDGMLRFYNNVRLSILYE